MIALVLDNFLLLSLNQEASYLGILLYFNWLLNYLRVLTSLQKKFLKDDYKYDILKKSTKTIRAPPNS